ncbi:FIST signal transduction protein [Croceivirga thetidis]|uniref:Histidine kinase n=1 Tax=Croceivirga thetidis TaxID=2721623 RepID=A0ABX1GM60_9FLAO|nr:FIST N-terminal domain-containing protein [Croceivirga thetidis]NKI30723.1 histidine kinase [Croceivirga thetidis]
MKIEQLKRTEEGSWEYLKVNALKKPLVLVFGDRHLLESENIYEEIKNFYPDGELVFGSTSGEILGINVFEKSITVTAIEFEHTTFEVLSENINDFENVEELGAKISENLEKENLRHLFVVSDGSLINGSELIEGLESDVEFKFSITGGLCGDGARFEKTLASYNDNPKQGEVIAIGLYGDSLEVTYGYDGGWTPFGPERTITKSDGNVLYEIDGLPALDLYKKYLGEKAKDLPEAALLYPLSVQENENAEPLVRTILNIDEETNSMILAGDVPLNSTVQLMMSTTNDIAEGAQNAALKAMELRTKKPELALLISCVGRRLVLDQRTEEEIEEVMDTVGEQASIAGFYSYGEMAPFTGRNSCQLHNQTMTLTLLSE